MRLGIANLTDSVFQFKPFKQRQLLTLFRLTIRNRTRQSVHLPYIPGYDIYRLEIFRRRRLSVPSRLQMFFKGHQKIDAGNQHIVALKFKPVCRLQSTVCPFQPIIFFRRIFIDNPKFSVEDADAVFKRNRLSAFHIVTRCKIRCLSASNFHAPGIDVLPPCFPLRKLYTSGRFISFEEHIRTLKPNLICMVVHLFYYPKGGKYFRMLFCSLRLLLQRFARPRLDDVGTMPCE